MNIEAVGDSKSERLQLTDDVLPVRRNHDTAFQANGMERGFFLQMPNDDRVFTRWSNGLLISLYPDRLPSQFRMVAGVTTV